KRPALFLAPMADVTNPAYRKIAQDRGADFTYTEMIHADGFNYGDPYAKNRGFSVHDIPYGIQIIGSGADSIAKAAAGLEEMFAPAVKVFDINMGCPAPPIIKTGCGAALMATDFGTESHPATIVRRVSDAVKTPVTAKIRIYKDDEKTIRLAKHVEDAGAAALTVHGRTRDQMYSGKANWDVIAKIKKELSIPVVLNGDIRDEKSLQAAADLTNCDGYMVGRGAIGNPLIFERLKYYLKTGELMNLSPAGEFAARLTDFKQYCLCLDRNSLYRHVNIRAHAQFFTTGLPTARDMRLIINDLHKDIKIRDMDFDALEEERRTLAFEITKIFERFEEKARSGSFDSEIL
ncbi:MAG: tRNA-dihydrouridine synthase family protein, partial [Methanimicrococcus sp.]|nr:tRNA-dihydrouridine synthase family protein [Methanimicrococcus sp.]